MKAEHVASESSKLSPVSPLAAIWEYVPNIFFRLLTRWRIILAAQLSDVIIILAVALLQCPGSAGQFGHFPLRYLTGAVAAALFCYFSFSQGHLYQVDKLLDEARAIKAILARWSLVLLGLAAMAALAHEPDLYSRTWFLTFYVEGFVALAAERFALAFLIRAWIARGYTAQSVILVGDNELSAALISRLDEGRSGIRVTGVFDDESVAVDRFVRGVPIRGSIDDLLEYTKTHATDLVVLTLPISDTGRINGVISKLRHQPLNIRVLPGRMGLDRVSPIRLSKADLPGVQLIAVADRPMSEPALFIKGAIDRIAAALALLMLIPLFLLIATGIAMTSPGPVFFRQRRIGYKGREFLIFKFRTMDVVDHPHIHLTKRNDPRVFKFGAFLRKTSLDELPQLINVLNGDMSLVGPRPHMPEARAAGQLYFEAVDEYERRHRVKPGITGWAQVNGWRGPTETLDQIERRVEHDIYYIENWSLMLDFVILVKTVFVGFFGKNAF